MNLYSFCLYISFICGIVLITKTKSQQNANIELQAIANEISNLVGSTLSEVTATVPLGSSAALLNDFKGNFQVPQENVKQSLIAETFIKNFIEENRDMPLKTLFQKLNTLDLSGTPLDKAQCDAAKFGDSIPSNQKFNEPVPDCLQKSSKFRTITGKCNNFLEPTWGCSFTKFRRFIPSAYSDGVSEPRNSSVTGEPLPCARAVSANTIKNDVILNIKFSHLLMQWGQFLDHDITQTPTFIDTNGNAPSCCQSGKKHIGCFPIKLCLDPFYSSQDQTCMEFVRSVPALNTGCSLGPREQMNGLTAYIDASNVYGSTEKVANNLREMNTGKLKSMTVSTNTRPLLPSKGPSSPETCIPQFNVDMPDKSCDFIAGDTRVNIIPTLVSMHTIWMREHNRLVEQLQSLQREISSEELYQIARSIVGAMMQHITYNEFLPLVFGETLQTWPQLQLLTSGYYKGYSQFVDPSISNSFATAAFRFGHGLVNEFFNLYDNNFQKLQSDTTDLRNHFFRAHDIYDKDMLERYLRGAIVENSQQSDNHVAEALTKFLFRNISQNFGLDLISLNVQRGRDHGLPAWVEFRKACGLPVPSTFNDLVSLNIMSSDRVDLFKTVYRDVNDFDLWPAGISEFVVNGGAIGPTFACIFADTFTRLRNGDRFWYENELPPTSGFKNPFTPEQLAEIRKVSLARVICDNTEIQQIRIHVMRADESLVSCDEIPKVDLTKFVNDQMATAQLFSSASGTSQGTPQLPRTKQELLDIFTSFFSNARSEL